VPLENNPALQRELEYHEKLYGGFAQRHFARPAVRALRAHLANRIMQVTAAGRAWRILSLGCGIGDTELLMAPQVKELVGIDLSPAAIRQAAQDARRAKIANAIFLEGALESLALEPESFDLVFGVFFLHHLPEPALEALPAQVASLLRPRGVFYSLDPSCYRLSGAVGSILFPGLMRSYQTPDERQLDPRITAGIFERHGFSCRVEYYDFLSSPLAGLLPGWRAGYRAARVLDELLIRTPLLRRLGSNFELCARR
jgi:SAM-dependent methyltransferase